MALKQNFSTPFLFFLLPANDPLIGDFADDQEAGQVLCKSAPQSDFFRGRPTFLFFFFAPVAEECVCGDVLSELRGFVTCADEALSLTSVTHSY